MSYTPNNRFNAVAGETLTAGLAAMYVPVGLRHGKAYGYTSPMLPYATGPWMVLVGGAAGSTVTLSETAGSAAVAAVYGYVMGGASAAGTYINNTDRLTFSSSSTAVCTAANLSSARSTLPGISDGAIYGYALGGYTGAAVVTSDRITLSSSSTAACTTANMIVVRCNATGISDGVVYGYILGGNSGSLIATSYRLNFSSSTISTCTTADVSELRNSSSGISDGVVYGYVLGGNYSTTYVTTTDQITFSSSVTAVCTTANLSLARSAAVGISDGAIYGYALGGSTSPGNYVTTTDQITFSSSVTAVCTTANLSLARSFIAGVSDGNIYGYTLGGSTAPGVYVNTADRITFSGSTTAVCTTANLNLVRYYPAGLSDYAV